MGNIVPVYIPQENVNDETVKIIQWLVGDGEAIQSDQPLVEVETSKSTFEIQSPASGVIRRMVAETDRSPRRRRALLHRRKSGGDRGLPHEPNRSFRPESRGRCTTSGRASRAARQQTTDVSLSADTPPLGGSRISRAALELIRSKGLNESDFSGRGLIRQHDVLAHLGQAISAPSVEPGAARACAARGGWRAGPQRAAAADQTIRGSAAFLEP